MHLFSFSALFAACTLLSPGPAAASADGVSVTQSTASVQRPENSLTLNVLPLLFNVVDVTYERVLGPQVAIQFNGGFRIPEPSVLEHAANQVIPLGPRGREAWALKAGLGMRWYVAGNAPTGFFVNPGAQIFSVPTHQVVLGSGHLMLGGAWLVANRFHMSASGGLQYLAVGDGHKTVPVGPLPAVQFSMGPAF